MHPSFLTQLYLISQFEVKRGFATTKGLLSVLTFAVVWIFILIYPLQFAADLLVQEKEVKQYVSFFEFIGFGSLQHWPVPEFGVFWQLGLLIFPMLSITLAADQTCSDRERGTLRFIVLRSSRSSIFFGRLVGVMTTQSLLIFFTGLSVLVLALYRDPTQFPFAFSNLLVVTVNLILVVLPFNAMMSALSVKVKSARQATIWAILIWTFLAGIISGFSYYLPALAVFKYLIPGYQLSHLSQLSEWQTLKLAYIPLLQALMLLAIGRWIMARQAL